MQSKMGPLLFAKKTVEVIRVVFYDSEFLVCQIAAGIGDIINTIILSDVMEHGTLIPYIHLTKNALPILYESVVFFQNQIDAMGHAAIHVFGGVTDTKSTPKQTKLLSDFRGDQRSMFCIYF